MSMRVHSIRPLCAALAVGLVAAGCFGPPRVPAAFSDDAFVETEYRVASADVLQIRVWKNTELSVTAPVLPDGSVTVPLAGQMMVRGLTTSECEDLIASELAEYITAPEVSVIVQQVVGKRVAVIGAVMRPGSQPLAANMRLVDALSLAGGFNAFANQRKVRVIRAREDGSEDQFIFDFKAFSSGRAPGTNVLLLPGDVVVVPD